MKAEESAAVAEAVENKTEAAAATPAAPAKAIKPLAPDAGKFQVAKLAELVESPNNPRRHFDQKSLQDLAANIAEMGIIEPLLVRPHPKQKGKFEILGGARRYRAAKIAGLDEAPVLVRTLDDSHAAIVMIIDNLQREDVHPLDEALSYKELIEKHHMKAEEIAAKISKSESHIYMTMVLSKLTAKIREWFFAGTWGAKGDAGTFTKGHAQLIARLPEKDQEECFKHWSYDRPSVRELSEWIHDDLYMNLDAAPWKKDDAGLIKGAGACTTCPKRTGNCLALFSDIKNKNACTDRSCFEAKRLAFLEQRKQEIAKAEAVKVQPVKEKAEQMLSPAKSKRKDEARAVEKLEHNWRKKNLVTINGKGGMYDEYECEECGAKARRYGVGDIVPLKKDQATCQKKQEAAAPAAAAKPVKKIEVPEVSEQYSPDRKSVWGRDRWAPALKSCKKPMPAIWADGKQFGQALNICGGTCCKRTDGYGYTRPKAAPMSEKEKAQRRKEIRAKRILNRTRELAFGALLSRVKELQHQDLQAIAIFAFNNVPWSGRNLICERRKWSGGGHGSHENKIKAMPPAELAKFLIEMTCAEDALHELGDGEDTFVLAKFHGVDVERIRKEVTDAVDKKVPEAVDFNAHKPKWMNDGEWYEAIDRGLHSVADAEKRFRAQLAKDQSDAALRKFLGEELGLGGSSSGPKMCEVEHKGGAAPFLKITHGGKSVTLKGAELCATVRAFYLLPNKKLSAALANPPAAKGKASNIANARDPDRIPALEIMKRIRAAKGKSKRKGKK